MFISVDKSLKEPVYIQIRDGIIALIKSGGLSAGDKLPGTRDLATQLGVSRKTVLQAYLELAADSWVETRPGSCTYVLDRDSLKNDNAIFEGFTNKGDVIDLPERRVDEAELMDWSRFELKGRFFGMPRYRDEWGGKEEWISFSRAIPDVRLFPFERIKKVSGQMLWDPQAYFFDYGHPQGYLPLVEYLELRMAKEGITIAEGINDIVITSGFQNALNLLLEVLVEPGDCVAVEDPTFNSILNLLTARGIEHFGVPMQDDGMDIDALEKLLKRKKPKLLITIPTIHNPTGSTMPLAKRERLLRLVRKHDCIVIEDNWSVMLGQDGKVEPSLKALDQTGHVIQICSLSKAFLPGTRVAWVILPSGISLTFVKAKRAMDRTDSYFLQTLVHEFIMKGFLDLHCRKVERIYRARRELMDELMQQHFPSGTEWTKPDGGFNYWVSLPAGMSSAELLQASVEQGIDFAPGNYFNVERRESESFRLSFSTLTQPQLRQGVKRLGTALSGFLAKSRKQISKESKRKDQAI